MTDLKSDTRLLKWMVGAVFTAQIVIGLPAILLLLRVAAKIGALS